jgi:hypothetical protein
MKTVRVGSNLTSNFPVMFALIGLGALYFYHRRGGSVRGLIGSARSTINRVAPSTTAASGGRAVGNTTSVAPSASI